MESSEENNIRIQDTDEETTSSHGLDKSNGSDKSEHPIPENSKILSVSEPSIQIQEILAEGKANLHPIPDHGTEVDVQNKTVSFHPNVENINLEKRAKWERFRGLSVGEFLREIEYEEEFNDQEIQNDEESLKISMMALGPIQEDDETTTDE